MSATYSVAVPVWVLFTFAVRPTKQRSMRHVLDVQSLAPLSDRTLAVIESTDHLQKPYCESYKQHNCRDERGWFCSTNVDNEKEKQEEDGEKKPAAKRKSPPKEQVEQEDDVTETGSPPKEQAEQDDEVTETGFQSSYMVEILTDIIDYEQEIIFLTRNERPEHFAVMNVSASRTNSMNDAFASFSIRLEN
jgi:hypothetical protein